MYYIYIIYIDTCICTCICACKAGAKQNSRGSPDTTSKCRRPQIDTDSSKLCQVSQCLFFHCNILSTVIVKWRMDSTPKMFKIVILSTIHSPTENNAEFWETAECAKGQFTGLQASAIVTQG